MKRFALAFFVMALFLSNLAAHAAGATFTTRQGEIFQLFLNGRLMNGPGSSTVKIDRLPAGPHNLEFRVPARRGYLTFCTKIFLERGFETNYVLIPPGYNRNFLLKKVSVVPLRPPVCNNCPPPRPHGHGSYNDVYDDYEPYGNQGGSYQNTPPKPGNNYNEAPGYGNNYNGNSGYGQPRNIMSAYDVDLLMESIGRKNFESSKLEVAKQALGNTFILAEDAKKLMRKFSFESTRVEFAKFVYARLYDQQNFYRVYDAFEFDSSISEVERWLAR
jgi:hypothetical protein